MLVEAVNKNYDKLNASDLQSLSIIMDNAHLIADMSIDELAKLCNTSKSTILRLTQKLDFSGYSEFKSCMKWEAKKTVSSNLKSHVQNFKQDFYNTCQQMETSQVPQQVAGYIHSARNVVVYGTGQAQRYCAMELQRLFMEVNRYVYYVGASDEFRMLSKDLNQDDVVIILSLSGQIDKIKDTLQLLKIKGVKTVSITNFHSNDLARMSDLNLYAISSPVQLSDHLYHNSFMNYLAVIEYVYLAYVELQQNIESSPKE